jgi:uncharacterized protein YndB with AHSA1/START domain
MTQRKTQHASFTIERTYAASPERVYDAWSNPASKEKWFRGPAGKWTPVERSMDFRVGGHERNIGRFDQGDDLHKGGMVSAFNAYYQDIVPGERIVYGYDMRLNDVRISVSVACVEIRAQGKGTLLTVTEHGVFLDGYDDAGSREQGTKWLLDNLAESLG